MTGLKGDNPRYYRANAVCKHFDAYGGPEDLPQSRLSFNAQVIYIFVTCNDISSDNEMTSCYG